MAMRASTTFMKAGASVEAACWAHVRRKFHDLYQAHRSPVAKEALERIAQLYAIESEIRGRSPAERREIRQARSRPLLEAMHAWLKATMEKTVAEIGRGTGD